MGEIDIEDLVNQFPDPQRIHFRAASVSSVHKHSDIISSDAPEEATRTVPGTQKIWIKTFGCSHNTSDSEFMAGQLAEYGYSLVVDDCAASTADLWLVNSCTVKGPSQSAVGTLVKKAKDQGKPILVSGCVPQGDRKA